MTTETYLDSIIVEYDKGSAWTSITQYVVGDIKGTGGLGGWKPDQRVGTLGTLEITMNNKGKEFSPMGGDSIRGLLTAVGFNRGARIRVRGVIGSMSYVIWTGRILSIESDDKNWGNEQVRVMAGDWMNIPAKYPMKGANIETNKRIDEAMTSLLARLSIQPEATSFAAGSNTFPAIFDNVQRGTRALSEFTKLANSELSYIYVTHDGTLIAENTYTRNGTRALDQVWIVPDSDSMLLLEDNTSLLLEDGTKIILDEGTLTDAAIATDMEEHDIVLTESSLINASIIRAFPVVTDTSLKVLYNMGTPLFIPSRETMEFSAHYTDPNGNGQISGSNMQTPVATTDYLANTQANGGGTDKTADIVVTATYYGDTVYYSILNGSTTDDVFITFLQARGYGIYYGNSIETTIDDLTSQNTYGYTPFSMDMKYQKDTVLAEAFSKSILEEYKLPKSRITKIKYLANLNKNHMMTFLTLAIGALILATEDRSGISNHYYITDRSFTIKQGGIINVEYGVKQNDSYVSGGLNPIGVEFRNAPGAVGITDSIDYGYLPQVVNLPLRTYTAWIYKKSSYTGKGAIIENRAEYRGMELYVESEVLYFLIRSVAGTGLWQFGYFTIQNNTKYFISVTYDAVNYATAPIVRINNALQTASYVLTPTGGLPDETGLPFSIGNSGAAYAAHAYAFPGIIYDARVYNRILTDAEITTLYNSGVANHLLVTSGLVFQGPAIYSDIGSSSTLDGITILPTDRVVENVMRRVGEPYGSPLFTAVFP